MGAAAFCKKEKWESKVSISCVSFTGSVERSGRTFAQAKVISIDGFTGINTRIRQMPFPISRLWLS